MRHYQKSKVILQTPLIDNLYRSQVYVESWQASVMELFFENGSWLQPFNIFEIHLFRLFRIIQFFSILSRVNYMVELYGFYALVQCGPYIHTAKIRKMLQRLSLHKKCLYLEFCWSEFFRILIKYGERRSISPNSVRTQENTDQRIPNSDTFYAVFLSVIFLCMKHFNY